MEPQSKTQIFPAILRKMLEKELHDRLCIVDEFTALWSGPNATEDSKAKCFDLWLHQFEVDDDLTHKCIARTLDECKALVEFLGVKIATWQWVDPWDVDYILDDQGRSYGPKARYWGNVLCAARWCLLELERELPARCEAQRRIEAQNGERAATPVTNRTGSRTRANTVR